MALIPTPLPSSGPQVTALQNALFALGFGIPTAELGSPHLSVRFRTPSGARRLAPGWHCAASTRESQAPRATGRPG